MVGIVRVWSHKACKNFVIYSQDLISGMDSECGENESYGMELECQQAQRLKKLPAH